MQDLVFVTSQVTISVSDSVYSAGAAISSQNLVGGSDYGGVSVMGRGGMFYNQQMVAKQIWEQ